jgi:hypothetical protein
LQPGILATHQPRGRVAADGRRAVSILTSQSKFIRKRLFTQEIAIARLNNFPETAFASSPQICGHFQRIVGCFIQTNLAKGISQLQQSSTSSRIAFPASLCAISSSRY